LNYQQIYILKYFILIFDLVLNQGSSQWTFIRIFKVFSFNQTIETNETLRNLCLKVHKKLCWINYPQIYIIWLYILLSNEAWIHVQRYFSSYSIVFQFLSSGTIKAKHWPSKYFCWSLWFPCFWLDDDLNNFFLQNVFIKNSNSCTCIIMSIFDLSIRDRWMKKITR
jgi:hypothetical protein